MKPANMMITPGWEKGRPDETWDATVKILDIGLGRELFDEDTPEGQIETQLTQEGSVLGTPDYLAPEQAKDARSADIRADVYSVGCVLYHCLTGRPPFPEMNIMAQMLQHATEKPKPLATFVDDVPAGFQQVMDRLLAKLPGERYQTPAEAAEALKPFVTGGAPAIAAQMVPAYKDWLESESHMEMPKALQPGGTVKSPALPANPAPAPPPKPGTAPAAALGTKARSGTAPAPALKSGGPVPPPARPSAAVPPPPPRPASRPAPRPVPTPAVEEVDVELVTEPIAAPAPASGPPVPAERPLWPPDRRDWLMLAAGAMGVLSAVGLGYGLARVLRRKSDDAE
jgi:hypothetical protein